MPMSDVVNNLVVRTHVARDLMQTAGLFKSERLVAWEYVVNGLQYVDQGVCPLVKVGIDAKVKKITIRDNGRGMDWAGLQNFFVMHGENQDRKHGRGGRGRFGTGKSAAFGIGELLRITTVCAGKRSRVELSRSDIEGMPSEAEIPVRMVEREVPSREPNGTLIEIERIHLRTINQKEIIDFIQRHLARWPNKSAVVFVNNHECEVVPPPIAQTYRFRADDDVRDLLGNIEITIHTAKRALDEEERGIAICSKGVWHQTTLAGSERREMAQYIFGEVDVPKLDDDWPISPFGVSRDMQLNPSNELVRVLFAFIGRKVEEVRKKLAEEERRRKATEDAKKLAQQASEIARLINEDFLEFSNRLAKTRARALGATDAYRIEPRGGDNDDELVHGGQIAARIVNDEGVPVSAGGFGGGGGEPRNLLPELKADATGEEKGKPAGGKGKMPRTRGGFDVRFEDMGSDEHRAKYRAEDRTIYINLDHPQVKTALGTGSNDDPVFRRLAYEVAFAEYAIALTMEFAQLDGHYLDPDEPIVDIRNHLDRLARKGAHLYAIS
jgi:Histidine kinase-, DNA gyrase B-, and HSP90-like ATPase